MATGLLPYFTTVFYYCILLKGTRTFTKQNIVEAPSPQKICYAFSIVVGHRTFTMQNIVDAQSLQKICYAFLIVVGHRTFTVQNIVDAQSLQKICYAFLIVVGHRTFTVWKHNTQTFWNVSVLVHVQYRTGRDQGRKSDWPPPRRGEVPRTPFLRTETIL